MRFANRVAIVTGGSRGIGRAVALGLAREGANVVVVGGTDPAAAEEVAGEIRQTYGRQARPVLADVSRRTDVDAMVATTLAEFGRIDVLIALAGIIDPASFLETSEEQWNRVLAVNLTGTFHSLQAVLPHMIHQGNGKVVTNTGPAALRGSPNGVAAYAASKAGVIALTRTVALEMKRTKAKVNVNCVSPVAQTRMTTAMARYRGMSDEEFGRRADAEACVPTFLFLASDDADYLHGQVIAADDGSTL